MKTKMVLTIVAAFALAAGQLAGADAAAREPDVMTQGHLNGWGWILIRDFKTVPLDIGNVYVGAAISVLDRIGSDNNEAVRLMRPHMSAAELSLALDHFYGTLLNRPIPIIDAFMAIKLRIEGADPGVQEKVAAVLRREAATKEVAK